MSKLFSPIQVGRMPLAHRLAMAPMTRFRVDDNHVPLDLVTQHYEQRAAVPGTLLITEATIIAPNAGGYPNVPGIWNDAQIAQWRKVTDAVHKKGSYIYMQLWALGRVANPQFLKANGNHDVVSSSPVALDDGPVPRELTETEIHQYIADYAQAAKNAIAAGFDGVEIHGANGYLIDQFTQDTVNKRTDAWGGSVENRSRFALEVIRAVSDAIGADRTAIRYSPFSTFQGMRMDNRIAQFTHLAEKTAEFKLAFVHLVEPRISGGAEGLVSEEDSLDFFVKAYRDASPLVVAGGFKADSAKEAVDVQYKDHEVLVGIGRPWTANPDLPFMIQNNVPLRPYQREVFYLPKDPKGYIDYDFSEEFKAVKVAA
ncbi:chanoclavine-I aldehyde reductase fgaOx3 [Aspergillus tubingensis]|uniref:alkene reductase n=1 Tax=Aspergillus tubingensis TaxID=5068 RepID=UPI001578E7CA|nr:NADH:flavin oxidoreductase/NADH oxidase family protein [Aspergillus tubingensis]GFN17641.1 NADH:flavin oxidoreductase/NADH oxidase family protein [Aspergillus tubingensis]GLA71947.1 chanoclavine-I aldehyde reductase fgaOx3 [Aspergillus tubingensis]GLB13944.1 chanoclavine-I aldehyde reductase fgaOx3 [Aspergillus tubingensis]